MRKRKKENRKERGKGKAISRPSFQEHLGQLSKEKSIEKEKNRMPGALFPLPHTKRKGM